MQRAVLMAAAVSACIGGTCLAQGVPCSYSVTVLPPHDCGLFQGPGNPHAINNLGHVLLTAPNCGTGYDETYIWTGGDTLTLIPRPAGMLGFSGFDLNDHGQIAGTAQMAGDLFAAIYDTTSEEWTFLEPPPTVPDGWSYGWAINNGQACGWRTIGGPPEYPISAFVWSPENGGTFDDLGLIDGMINGGVDIADDGVVAVIAALGLQAFTWNGDRIRRLGFFAGAESITPNAIANGQHVVGGSRFVSGPVTWAVPFEYNGGLLQMLPVLSEPFTSCTALGVTSAGLIVGGCRPVTTADWRPVSWLGGRNPRHRTARREFWRAFVGIRRRCE